MAIDSVLSVGRVEINEAKPPSTRLCPYNYICLPIYMGKHHDHIYLRGQYFSHLSGDARPLYQFSNVSNRPRCTWPAGGRRAREGLHRLTISHLSGDARPLYQFSNLSNRYRQTIFTHDHDYVYIILYCICNPAFPSRYTVSCLTLFTNYDAKSTGFFILLMIV